MSLRSLILVCLLAWQLPAAPTNVRILPPGTVPPSSNGNAYFTTLLARSDFWKGYSFRPRAGEPIASPYYEKQLARPSEGGYQSSNSAPLYVTYDATVGGAKVVIPAFSQPGWNATLAAGLTASDTHIVPTVWASYVVGRQVKVDNEVMLITAYDPSTVVPRGFTVARGQYRTAAVVHASGVPLYLGANTLGNQVRVPIGTQDGHTYLFTWDVMFTSSYLGTGLAGNKTFQFTSGGDAIWLEMKTRMDGGAGDLQPPGFDPKLHVAGIDMRVYNTIGGDANWLLTDGNHAGPGVTDNDSPLRPLANTFIIYPNRWTRYWLRIDQRVNDYDYFDLWVADEQHDPVHLYVHLPVSVRPTDFSINKFWIEFNDSQAILPAGRTTDFRDLVAYVRNLAILRDAPEAEFASLRQKPSK